MTVYTYNADGYYTGPHCCQACPKTGGLLYPPRYTETPPPAGAYQIARAVNGAWKMVPDNRGRQIYNTTDGSAKLCDTLDIPNGYTLEPPPASCYKWDGKTWVIDAAAQKERDNAIIIAKLAEIDMASIRSMREYIAAQADAPQYIKDHEASAKAEREKLK